jgi:hypothetical protein
MADEAFGVVLVLGHGGLDTRIKTGGDYSGITVLEALIRTPTHQPKGWGDWFIPSSYRSFDARCHEVQREKGLYWMLTADIDSGNHSLEEIKSIVIDCFGVAVACRIYSSSSSTIDNKKWRVLIPLLNGVPYQKWTAWQKCLILYFKKHGVILDEALCRSAQIVYLPNIPDRNQFYESEIFGNELLEFTACHKWMDFVSERLEVWRIIESQKKVKTVKIKKSGNSTIDQFNRDNKIEDLLQKYGYQHDGRENWRSPFQTTASFATKNKGDYWISLSRSDRDAGLGRETASGHSSGTAFSLYCFYEFNGSVKDALRSLKE